MEDQYSPDLSCVRCMHKVKMKILKEYSQVKTYYQDDNPALFSWNEGSIYQMLLCPACDSVSFAVINYHEAFSDEVETEILYPLAAKVPEGLPERVAKGYEAARRVRGVDANAFGVLLRRVLELVCQDRGAEGRFLNDELADLANRAAVPQQLVDMAHRLRTFGNIGAHPAIGELRDEEVPVLEKLCEAFLEYVYHGPRLLEEADLRLRAIQR